jgi:hypothetical protein
MDSFERPREMATKVVALWWAAFPDDEEKVSFRIS